jgi:predicted PurR-regulated permease PerM
MTLARPITFWIVMLLALVAVVVLLREVLLPFVAGMVLAYLLDPLANRFERLGMNRLLATLAIIVAVFLTIAVVMFVTIPIIVREVELFIDNFPLYVRKLHDLATDPARPWLSKMVGEGLAQAEKSFDQLTALASGWFWAFLNSLWSGGRALISVVSLTIVTPIVACYLIYDWNGIVRAVDNWIPPANRDTVRALAREVDETIGGFVRGQTALCLVLAIYYGAALWLIGLKHGAIIGIAAGLISFIPYVGVFCGLVVATCIAIAQFWPNWSMMLLVPAIFFVGNSLSDYVLAPYLVGRRIGLGPVWIMFALFAFGYLFGFVGLLIAVPLAAAIGVLLRFALRQYYASPLYAGAASVMPPHVDASIIAVNRRPAREQDLTPPPS